MTEAAPRKITLGGFDYPIAPVTLGQMRSVAPCFTRIGIDTPEGVSAQITIIHAAIYAADHTVKVADIDALTGVTFDELKDAVDKIGQLMGLGKKEAPAGEAPAPPQGAAPVDLPSPQ